MSVLDVVRKTEDSKREFFRFIHPAERLALQGFPLRIMENLPADIVSHAAGNAYPVPLICSALHPALTAIAENTSFDFKSWPPATALGRNMPSGVAAVAKGFKRAAANPKKYDIDNAPADLRDFKKPRF